MSIKIISYNVNGIRAALKKGLSDWLLREQPHIFCVQETKASPEQVDLQMWEEAGYTGYWYSAQKKGYSGVAIFSRLKPVNACYGMDIDLYDMEGRTIRLDFPNFSVLNTYFPSGTMGGVRQSFKMQYLGHFQEYIQELSKSIKNLVITGDFNICHREIDIHNPVANKNTTGFLPEEREWISSFLQYGFRDSFRMVNSDPHQYTWWSYRNGARQRNLGWRLDYQMVSEEMAAQVEHAAILADAVHSDHCPTLLTLK